MEMQMELLRRSPAVMLLHCWSSGINAFKTTKTSIRVAEEEGVKEHSFTEHP